MGKSVVSIKKMIIGILTILMVVVAVANAASASAGTKDGTYRIELTALQEKHNLPSQMDRSIVKPAYLKVQDGKAFVILTITGSSNLGSISYKTTAGEFERVEVIADDKTANTRTVKIPVQNLDKPVVVQTVIIPAGGITVRFRVALNKNSLESIIVVLFNGQEMNLEVPPTIVEGRTLVPPRAIFEALGAEVVWDQASQTVTGTKEGTVIKLTIGNTTAYVNDKPITLDVPGKIVNQRALFPLRFISESLGADVEWEGATRTVIIDNIAPQDIKVKAMHATNAGEPSRSDSNLVKPAKFKVMGSITYVYLTMNSADIMFDFGVVNSAGEFKLARVFAENLIGATSQEKTRTYKFEVPSLDAPVLVQTTVNRGAAGTAQVQFILVFEK